MSAEEFNLNAVYKLMKYAKDFGHEKVKLAGYTSTEHLICTYLYYHDGVSQDTVAEYLAMDKTTVAKALTSLETKGLVLRNENAENRRKNKLQLTASSRKIIGNTIGLYKEWSDYVTVDLTDAEKQAFMDIGNKMCERAKAIFDENK